MNTRQLSQGLKPTLEFERMHTFKSFRQFPELRKSVQEIESIAFASADPLHHMRSGRIRRPKLTTTTHRLAELSQSSLSDVSSVMDDFRRIMLENRRKNTNPYAHQQQSTAEEEPSTSLDDQTLPRKSIASRPPLLSRRFSVSALPEEFKRDPLLRANEKLKKIAVSFDASATNSHLAGFQGAKLTKKEFSTLLRRCLNIHLKTVEIDALFHSMDRDDSGLIDGVEFIRYFFHLGNEAKQLISLETKERQRRKLQREKEQKSKALLEEKLWQKAQIVSFTAADVASAHAKLKKAAFLYDPNNIVDHDILHKLRALLTPFDFQQQVSKCFMAQGMQLHFTGAELAALIDEYLVSRRETRAVSCTSTAKTRFVQNPNTSSSTTNSAPNNVNNTNFHSGGTQKSADPLYIAAEMDDNSTHNDSFRNMSNNVPFSDNPPTDATSETEAEVCRSGVKALTDADLDGSVDGYAFVTDFVHLSQSVWKEHNQLQTKLQSRRQRVLEMGQHTDIMPKSLGR